MKKLLGTAFVGLLLTQAPALAGPADVVAGCGGGQNCVQLVAQYIADLKKSGQTAPEIDDMLSDLVIELASAAQGQSGTVRNNIASGIKTASAAFEDDAKSRQSSLVASSISRNANTQISAVSASDF